MRSARPLYDRAQPYEPGPAAEGNEGAVSAGQLARER